MDVFHNFREGKTKQERMTSKFCAIVPVAIVLYLAALAAAKSTDPDDPEFIDFGGDIEVVEFLHLFFHNEV